MKDKQPDLTGMKWLSGAWQGQALGGDVEEIWSHPSAGSLMGSFKLIVDEEIKFYELMTISKEREHIVLRIKHFDAALNGWEERDQCVEAPLVSQSETRLEFQGFVYQRVSPDHIRVTVRTHTAKAEKELHFDYRRVELR